MASGSVVRSPIPLDYRRACQHVADLMRDHDGIKAIAAKYYGDYADIWVIAEPDCRFALIRPLGEAIQSAQEAFPGVRLDSHVTLQSAPDDFTIWG